MARGKFKTPEPAVPEVAIPEGRPPFVSPARYLIEKATGIIHPYTDDMAARGDLVEAYNGTPPKTGRIDPNAPVAPVKRAARPVDPAAAPMEPPIEALVPAG